MIQAILVLTAAAAGLSVVWIAIFLWMDDEADESDAAADGDEEPRPQRLLHNGEFEDASSAFRIDDLG